MFIQKNDYFFRFAKINFADQANQERFPETIIAIHYIYIL